MIPKVGLRSRGATPFSFRRLSLSCAAVVFITVLVVAFALSNVYGVAFAPFLALVLAALLSEVTQKVCCAVIWPRLPAEFRNNCPYDSAEAAGGKGTIHSMRDLRIWAARARPPKTPA